MSEHTRRDTLKRLGAAGAIGTVGLAGCSQQSDTGGDDETDTGSGDTTDGEAIQFGTLFPVTGPNSAYGGGQQEAANLARDEINSAGGPLDREIEITNRDTEGSPDRAAQKFRTMINEQGIVGLIGPYSSGIGTTLAPIARDNRVMEISNGNTSPALADAGINEDDGNKYYGRTAPNDNQQGQVMARIMNQTVEADSASFLYVNNPYGEGLAGVAEENFEGETLNMVGYSQETSDYSSTLEEVFADDPDVVGAVMYPGNGETILTQWDQGGYGGQWVCGEAIYSPEMLSDLSDIVEGMYITSPQTANSETFQENIGGEENITLFAPHAYDATYLEALAIQRGGEASGAAIAENIQQVSRPEGTTVGVAEFETAKSELESENEVNYDGASGSVDLNDNLEPVVPFDVLEVQDGVAEAVEQVPVSYFQ